MTGVAGLAWFVLFLQQPLRGYEDTDDPARGVQFVRDYPDAFTTEAGAAIVLAIALACAAPALRRWLRADSGTTGDDRSRSARWTNATVLVLKRPWFYSRG